MESLTDYGHNVMDNGTKVHHFLHRITNTELWAVVNIVQAQPEKYSTTFDVTVSYLGQMTKKKHSSTQSFCITKIESQPMKSKVAAFMG